MTEWAELLLDYVYPGGLLMAFGGTRTYHRLTAGLEDAGWEITDCMVWVTARISEVGSHQQGARQGSGRGAGSGGG